MPEQPAGGAGVRSARLRAGLTLRQLAAGLGVSVGTMSAIENGKVGLTVDRLRRIAEHLAVPPSELLEPPVPAPVENGPPPPPSAEASWREFGPLDLDPVLSSAVEVFTETGYHGATMRVIATGAGVSIAGMYHHYPSKQRLLVTLVEDALLDLGRRTAAARREASDVVQAFSDMVEALVLFHTERAELAYLVISEMRSVEEPDRARLARLQGAVQASLDDLAAQADERGRFRVRDVSMTTRAITSMCLAPAFWFPGPGRRSPEDSARLARRYAELALVMVGHTAH